MSKKDNRRIRVLKELREAESEKGDTGAARGPEIESVQPQTQSLKSQCDNIRYMVAEIGKDVLALKFHPQMEEDKGDRSEMIANVMLAYRHLEDARMRIGKVLQAYDGGTSVYDKEKK